MTMIEREFEKVFGAAPAQLGHAPGRVNLIGEHTDYNGGLVLPTTLPIGIEIALRPRDDGVVRVASNTFDHISEARLSDSRKGAWADYSVGAILYAHNAGLTPRGADLYIHSTMPAGAGLSSSAALIVAILKGVRALSGKSLSDMEIALLARKVENEYIGVPVGIMDQMAVALAAPGQALALDTKSLSFELIDLPATHHMAVIHSGVSRNLSDGRYAERKSECDAARKNFNMRDLCLLTDEDIAEAPTLPDTLARRVRHCMSEHQRTAAAATALRSGAIESFGELMNESHRSMRDDFEMSLPQIDSLVADAQRLGATGARLTGGGFGGCIVACIPKPALSDAVSRLLNKHPHAYFVC